MTIMTPAPTDEEEEMLVPRSDLVFEGPQPMEETGNDVEKQPPEDPQTSRFTWKIDNFSRLNVKKLYSDPFVVGGYKWRILIFPKGNNVDYLSMYLDVADSANLPYGWSRYAQFNLSIVNQIHNKYSIRKETQHQFNARESDWGFTSFMPLGELYDPNKGYLVDDTCVVDAEVAVRKIVDYWSYDSKRETGFVGLKNQGATCYMNSLLQTLYHIPYFRKAVYHMPTTENDMPSASIPLALQSLFYKLQYSDNSVATKELTKSFGWDTYDSFLQHDVQELNRVLCEKLEEKMKGTVVEGTIQQLFEGHHMNYIECINVDYKSTRKESFYDLQLDVKGCADVYASFDKYVEVERLEGDNKYHAEQYGLQDAKKGVLFMDFPPVLQLQLKRFEYDFSRDTMVKINDRYEFPLQLDLDRENGKYLSPEADGSVRNLYTLHSVLVHSGGVHGGHYYAFIRPTLSDQWYKFDDERVTKEDVKRALEEQYGGEEEQLPQTNPGFNNTPFKFTKYSNAYMLVYIRECDKEKIMCNVDEKDIAEHLRARLNEYDIADLVNDLHSRLKYQHLDGDKVDFVYIDEVQDLTMRQIALFKYICRNVEEGFVFSGDTAQTIARGIDFRFEDIRNLFYTEFVMDSNGDEVALRKDKGHLSPVFQLLQNFRTHAGVLKLAQSVVDLLCHYFPHSVDFLKPETSLIYGEAPVLLKPGADENAILTIFGNTGSTGEKMIGFGAEQVILVRDESAKKEISGYIGRQALILTIVECKGLEFQDVLLYNFFGSSPLRNQWRVVYEFMKGKVVVDISFPNFCEERHSLLCSELKQLYVAITRTRQRLWICESVEEFSKPMFDYWRGLCLVELREIDDSLAQAMQTSSTPEEWKSRGVKLFWEKNYEMAIMCFEKAGERNWEKRAKAAGFRASAERIRDSNSKESCTYLRQAAEIFDSIGRFEAAAECFYDLREYERAGQIYLEKCGKPELIKAAECFTLAGCYEQAARVYAKGSHFSECLSVCTKGKCFDLGLQYVEYWKHDASQCSTVGERETEIDKMEEEFLSSCALHYFELNDRVSMMRFVKAFPKIDMKRNLLKSLGCLDELLLLEEELGNFTEAAEIARLEGNTLREADITAKNGDFDKASSLVLLYVLSKSLWISGGKGWPLKSFSEKKELLEKAMSLAMHGSKSETTCTVVKVLSNESSDWSSLKHVYVASQKCNSPIGEILSCRKILDVHCETNVAKYIWDDHLSADVMSSEELLLCSQVSVRTLLHFWNLWKKIICDLIDSLQGLEIENFGKYNSLCNFCVNYFGARQRLNDLNVTYALLHPTAEWVKKIHQSFIRRSKKIVLVDARDFIYAARQHWHAELLIVGLKVLDTLESIYKSAATSESHFRQSMCLLNMYDIAKFASEAKDLDSKSFQWRLRNFLTLSTEYFDKAFPLDPRQSLMESMISLRRTELSRDLLQEFIHQDIINTRDVLSYGQIGRVMNIWLGSGKLSEDLYKKIVGRDLPESWRSFMETLRCIRVTKMEESQSGNACGGKLSESHSAIDTVPSEVTEVKLVEKFYEALQDTYSVNWIRLSDYISPGCFLYLVERFFILVSQSKGFFFTTKSSLVEWLISEQSEVLHTSKVAINQQSLEKFYHSVLMMVQQFLSDKGSTALWITRSRINFDAYYRILVMRLVVVLCLLCVNSGKYYDVLSFMLRNNDVRNQLPKYFYGILFPCLKRKYFQISEIGEAFKIAGDPLLCVNLCENTIRELPNVIHVQLGTNCNTEDIFDLLFPARNESQAPNSTVSEVMTNPDATSSLDCSDQPKILTVSCSEVSPPSEQNLQQVNWDLFKEVSDFLKLIGSENDGTTSTVAQKIKEEINMHIKFLTAAITLPELKKPDAGEDMAEEVQSMLQELQQLHSFLDTSNLEVAKGEQLLKSLLSRKSKIEALLSQCIVSTTLKDSCEEQGNAVCVEDEKIESPSIAAYSESSNKAKQTKGKAKAKSKKSRKGKGKK